MATTFEIEAATKVLRDGRDWATSEPEMVALTTSKVEAALDAAAMWAEVRPPPAVPDVAGMVVSMRLTVERVRRDGVGFAAAMDLLLSGADALSAQAAEIATLKQAWSISMAAGTEAHAEIGDITAALAAKEAECERLREALSDLVNGFAWSAVAADCDEARDNLNSKLRRARSTLAGKPEEGG